MFSRPFSSSCVFATAHAPAALLIARQSFTRRRVSSRENVARCTNGASATSVTLTSPYLSAGGLWVAVPLRDDQQRALERGRCPLSMALASRSDSPAPPSERRSLGPPHLRGGWVHPDSSEKASLSRRPVYLASHPMRCVLATPTSLTYETIFAKGKWGNPTCSKRRGPLSRRDRGVKAGDKHGVAQVGADDCGGQLGARYAMALFWVCMVSSSS